MWFWYDLKLSDALVSSSCPTFYYPKASLSVYQFIVYKWQTINSCARVVECKCWHIFLESATSFFLLLFNQIQSWLNGKNIQLTCYVLTFVGGVDVGHIVVIVRWYVVDRTRRRRRYIERRCRADRLRQLSDTVGQLLALVGYSVAEVLVCLSNGLKKPQQIE